MRNRKANPEEVARYRIETEALIKDIAKHFGISKPTVDNYIREVKENNPELADKLEEIGKQRSKKASPEEVVQYRIETKASIEEVAKHFEIYVDTVYRYIKEVKEKNPELADKLEEIGKQRSKKASPEEVVRYRIETKASIEEIAKHFDISVDTVYRYIKEVKEKNPELKDKLEQIGMQNIRLKGKLKGKTRSKKVSPEEVVQYRIEHKAGYEEIAKHFEISVGTAYRYIKEVKEKNPELKDKLKKIGKQIRKPRSKKVSPEEVAQYRIEHKVGYEEIAEHFGISVTSVAVYLREVRECNPELKEKLDQNNKARKKKANPEEVAQYRIEHKVGYEEIAEHFGISVATVCKYLREVRKCNPELIEMLEQTVQNKQELFESIQQENALLKAENSNLKARIALLEQELQEQRAGLQATKQGIQETMQDRQNVNESDLDVLLRVFDKGKITDYDAERLLQYKEKLEVQYRNNGRNPKWNNSLNYSTMISTINSMLTTRKDNYQQQKATEFKRFISPKNFGPLYELEDGITIGKLLNKIQMLTGEKVSSVELSMIINCLTAEGKADEVSSKINTEAINNIRSKIENCYEKIEQEGLLLMGEAR